MAGVILTGVSRVFPGGVVACDALDLEIRDGELLVLVGPSGSGKTTLLRLIAGLERPTSGTITIGGRVVNGVSPSQRNLAMVFQSHALHPHWTAYENIAFGLRLKKPPLGLERVWRKFARSGREPATASGPELRQRVLDAARQLGIDGLLERLPSELSGGEQQRVALAPCFCSTSRSPAWMPSCGWKCGGN
jgi:multiple sugar transport system ATP-binding protein